MDSGAAFEFRGTKRFEVRRQLGAGGMGIVYEALDRKTDEIVAIKTLRRMNAQALFRLKHEFRALQDLHHTNLVELGELIENQGQWFFTMELLAGVDFLEHVGAAGSYFPESHDRQITAPAAPLARERVQIAETGRADTQKPVEALVPTSYRFDETRLRTALAGLAQGVHALHQASMVHRDIKPTNIMVTREGRVVLLDFGLIVESGTDGLSRESHVVGTAAYMAPEQAAGKPTGPAADWHSVGVLLYESLTGRLPYTGSSIEILLNKQKHAPAPPHAINPDAPQDLDALCVELLDFSPESRPTGPKILERLGVVEATSTSATATITGSQGSGGSPFVGREHQLDLLHAAFKRTRSGEAASVYVHGESGVGKSALTKQFLRQIEAKQPNIVVLSGRCYERESLQYKAFDGVVDSLSQYMKRLPDWEVGTLLPRNAALLPRVFPVLGRVEVIAQAPRPTHDVKDPHELRTRVFTALRELLRRLSERRSLVITIDGLHWADADSALLLRDLMAPPDSPPLLLIITSREPQEPSPQIPGHLQRLALEPLEPAAARNLAKLLLRRASASSKLSAAEIAVDARGNPLFIDQLVRQAIDGAESPGSLALDDVIWQRVTQLDVATSLLLELVCVAGRPLYQEAFRAAARMEQTEFARRVAALRVAQLVRGRRHGNQETIEPHHDRVRETVLERLAPGTRKKRHARLAIAMESAGAVRLHPQMVMRHFEAAGAHGKAVACAIKAGDRAASALAFDRATEFFRTALRLVQSQSRRQEVRLRLARALVNAGQGAAAAEVFLESAGDSDDADPSVRIDCRRQAAEQLLTCGHVIRGLEVLEQLLPDIGASLASSGSAATRAVFWQRAKIRLRGARSTARLPEEIPARTLQRLDVFQTASHGLAMIDPARGADFHARGLALALRTGDNKRTCLYLAMEALYIGATGPRGRRRAQSMLIRARKLAQATGDHRAITWTVLARGFQRYFENRFASAAELLAEVEGKIRVEATGMSWELSSARIAHLWSLRQIGDLRRLRDVASEVQQDAARRGDHLLSTSCAIIENVTLLADDNPSAAEAALDEIHWPAPAGAFHLQHWWLAQARAELELYRGTASLESSTSIASDLRHSQLSRIESVRIGHHWLRARLALASPERDPRLAEIDARAISRVGGEYASLLAHLLRAAIHAQDDHTDRAIQNLKDAAEGAQRAEFPLFEAVANYRLGQLRHQPSTQATTFFEAQSIANPRRFSNVIAPGFPR